jgi:phosphoribosylformylglycinamidine cyclo-ligase
MAQVRRAKPLSYASAGVDRAATGTALAALLAQIRYRPPARHGRPLEGPGHYAGLMRVGREVIAVTTDTVGTKVLLAAAAGRWSEVGEDMVAINVNDLASVGARPFGLVDTVSCARADPSIFAEIGRGLNRGLVAGRCALLGGETAIVPDIVAGIDLGATALGFFPGRRRPITGLRIRPGDRLIGVPSSGLHSNGFTLVRRLLDRTKPPLGRPRPGGRGALAIELLRPTRSYVPASEALADHPGIRGLAHVSGGGVRNLVRLHPRVGYLLDEWPRPPSLFTWLQCLGPVTDEEMFQTFNMGVGFIAVVTPGALDAALSELRAAGVRDARPIGVVDAGPGIRLPAWNLIYRGYV